MNQTSDPASGIPLDPNGSPTQHPATMKSHSWTILVLALVGCRAAQEPRVVPVDHPANPRATAAEIVPGPDPFEVTPTYAMPDAHAPASTPHGAHGTQLEGTGDVPVQYTCPMHPHVVQDQPGNCPECGMLLRPIAVHEHDGQGQEP